MTKPTDRDYYARRLSEERSKAAAASDEATARIHATLAEAYAQKLAAFGDSTVSVG